MGDLPAARVTATRPFYTCGLDYAGPFLVKEKTRTRVSLKAYLCIFVCFTTKAVHLELTVDLSTDAFFNCLQRFIARRGKPGNIHSDNGTNFVGAKNELNELGCLLSDKAHRSRITDAMSKDQIQWHMIPPHAPQFGGLWESAVESAKYHLRRVIGETRLTFEELYTLLTQVEACLNSRPLTSLSDDPNDPTPLTPRHFLIGDSMAAIPQPNFMDVPINRMNRYQHLSKMFQDFWK
ncbi:hypothetical protein KPH14_000830 [Odynerus spinipes]|uniref:Integrase catalytic domain-containing protein n=1 Tax=Odynerus spinipes TaxID=1348599 RepID=A0AAD9VIY0_9HYME|nr:hypothetical protein KPH14_000830 [Odynerus spinipes]